MIFFKSKQKGFFLIEVVIGTAILGSTIVFLLGLVQNTVEISQKTLERTQASYLLEEGVEATKTIRDDAWSNISSLLDNTVYYLSWNGTRWSFSTTASTIDSFTRTVTFDSVSRDINDDIVFSGGSYDDSRTRKATVNVSWQNFFGSESESLTFFLSDIRT